MLSERLRGIDVEDPALATLKTLATQVSERPMMYSLLMSDVNLWQDLDEQERQRALARAKRRVSGVLQSLPLR
jgi:hypothetical protein